MKHAFRRYGDLLGRYLGPYRGRTVVLALLLFGATGLQLANPQFLRTFIDAAQAGEPTRVLITAALVYLGWPSCGRWPSAPRTWATTSAGGPRPAPDLAAHCRR